MLITIWKYPHSYSNLNDYGDLYGNIYIEVTPLLY